MLLEALRRFVNAIRDAIDDTAAMVRGDDYFLVIMIGLALLASLLLLLVR